MFQVAVLVHLNHHQDSSESLRGTEAFCWAKDIEVVVEITLSNNWFYPMTLFLEVHRDLSMLFDRWSKLHQGFVLEHCYRYPSGLVSLLEIVELFPVLDIVAVAEIAL